MQKMLYTAISRRNLLLAPSRLQAVVSYCNINQKWTQHPSTLITCPIILERCSCSRHFTIPRCIPSASSVQKGRSSCPCAILGTRQEYSPAAAKYFLWIVHIEQEWLPSGNKKCKFMINLERKGIQQHPHAGNCHKYFWTFSLFLMFRIYSMSCYKWSVKGQLVFRIDGIIVPDMRENNYSRKER